MKLDDYLTECNEVYHTTINPKGPGVIRIHLIPPKKLKAGVPWVTILNGYYLLPLQTSWAVLLKLFIDELNKTEGNPYDSLDGIIDSTINNAKKIFFDTKPEFLKKDLKTTINSVNKAMCDISTTLAAVNTVNAEDKTEIQQIVSDTAKTTANLKKFSEKLNKRFLLFRLMF